MTGLRVELPDELVELIASRAAALVVEQLAERAASDGRSEFLTVAEAAELLQVLPPAGL